MVMNRFRRKAVFVEHNISYSEVAAAVGCNVSTVSRVATGLTVRQTDTAERIKRELAKRADVPVEELWPPAQPSSATA